MQCQSLISTCVKSSNLQQAEVGHYCVCNIGFFPSSKCCNWSTAFIEVMNCGLYLPILFIIISLFHQQLKMTKRFQLWIVLHSMIKLKKERNDFIGFSFLLAIEFLIYSLQFTSNYSQLKSFLREVSRKAFQSLRSSNINSHAYFNQVICQRCLFLLYI